MKKLILLLFVISTLSLNAQSTKERKVLNKYILGVDDVETIKFKIKKYYEDWKISDWTDNETNDKLTFISSDKYNQRIDTEKYRFVFINNKLFSVAYYLISDKKYDRYKDKLYKTYNVQHYQGEYSWFNEYVSIEYVSGEDNEPESFVHYDSGLLKKYPQYKYF